MDVIAYTVSETKTSRCAELSGGCMETISGTEKGPFSIELTREVSSCALLERLRAETGVTPSDWASGRRGTRWFRIPRKSGAWLFAGE
jgi:hypothetical protein